MPSRLASLSRTANERAVTKARSLETRVTIQAKGPWKGWTPDIDVDLLDATAARIVTGLIAKPDPGGQGEVLTADNGYARVDGASAALSDLTADWTDSNTATANTGANDVIQVAEFLRTTAAGASSANGYGLNQIAFIAGDGSTANSAPVFRIDDDGSWEIIESSAAATSAEPLGNRDAIPDWAIMPSGAGDRSTPTGFADIDEPCIVWCNGIDDARVFPHDTSGDPDLPDHEQLTDEAAIDPFIPRSLENFRGRMFYFNINENGTHHRQRLRWTQPFTADPSPTNAGSGVIDFREFQRDGLRIETLGDVMACYFEDGVSFVSLTGIATFPVQRSILTQKRGLLATHAVCPIDPNVHFGIFNDGWWLLDSSGRWTEVGIMDVGGTVQRKWRDTFYGRLDANNRARLFCYYDDQRGLVYIVTPVEDVASPTEVWIWDPRTDRVWLDDYPVDPMCFGSYTINIQTAITWAAAAGTWASPGANVSGTWAEAGSRFGFRGLVHGNGSGRVMRHDGNIFTKDGMATTYGYETVLGPLGVPRKLKTTERVTLEAINKATPNPTVTVFGDSTTGSQSGSANLNRRSQGDIEVDSVWSRLTSEQIGIRIGGTHPLMLRSFEADLLVDDAERRNG